MISLADDRYIDEIFRDKISGRRKNIFVTFTAVAAALALVAGGISYFVSNAGNDTIAVKPPAVSEQSAVTDNFEEQPFSYEELFRNKYDGDFPLYFDVYASKIRNESTSAFEMDYALSILPFKAEGFWDKRSQFYVYLDENGVPFGGTVYLESEFDETASPKFRGITIDMGKSGAVSHDFPVEKTVPADRFGTKVYCFDDTAAYLADVYNSNLKAYFAIGDMEYAVETCNISAAETGEIIDSIINSGFSQDSFDLTRGYDFYHTATKITFDEANATEPFTGYVPFVDGVIYLYDGVTYSVQTINGEVNKLMNVVYTDQTDDGERIMFEYYTNGYAGKEHYEKTAALQDITLESLDGFMADGEYKFTVDCGKFMINVRAKCSPDKVMKYIDAIRGGTSSGTNSSKFDFAPFGALAEANKLEPFVGYVPTVKEIGDMKIYTGGGSEVLTADSEEYGRVLNIAYQSEVTGGNVYGEYDFKAISVTYAEKKAYNIPESPVISVEQLPIANLDELKTDGIREGGRACYRFVIDCGTCYITVAADCLPEEMREYVSAINPNAAEKAEQERIDEQNAAFERIVKGGSETLTFEKVKKLAEKGDKLDWSDFENFSGTEVGSGLFIMAYSVENTDYWVHIGGVPGEKPWYVYLSEDWNEQRIDIRYDSIDDFLADDKVENLLTIDKVKELAKKGDDLTWSDFEAFDGTDVGSGSYIMVYAVYGTDYTVAVGGGSLDQKPMYIHFGSGDGNYIDIRYDSIDDFLNEN